MDSQNKHFIGVDIAKATLEVAFDDTRKTASFGNDEAGIAALLAQLRAMPVALVLMEATGGYERLLARHHVCGRFSGCRGQSPSGT